LNVEIINPKVLQSIYENHGIFSCECYNTPQKYSEKVGKSCQESGHYSGSRTEYIKFKISGVDRGTLEQIMRTEIGARKEDLEDVIWMEQNLDLNPTTVVKNMKSFRYVDMGEFEYTTPEVVKKSKKATEMFENIMLGISNDMDLLKKQLDNDFPDVDNKVKLEATQFCLPRATNTSLVIGMTIEAFIKYIWKRLCIRTQPEHRSLAKMMVEKVLEIKPEYKSKLVPHCKHLLWCPEGSMCCGAYPTRDELEKKLR